jgi:preprotein translocase subunit SecG
MNIVINVCLAIYVIVALLMVFVILMQRPKSEGLGAAFGGGVTENIFGAQTTNVLTKVTAYLAGIFFLLTFLLSIMYAHRSTSDSALRRELMRGQPAPTDAAASPGQAPGAAPGGSAPPAQPGPSSAVGPPGTVTNPTPAGPAAATSVAPADMAVGAAPAATQPPAQAPTAPAASAPPKP